MIIVVFIGLDDDPPFVLRIAGPDEVERAEQVVERLIERIGPQAEIGTTGRDGIRSEALAAYLHAEAGGHLVEHLAERAVETLRGDGLRRDAGTRTQGARKENETQDFHRFGVWG